MIHRRYATEIATFKEWSDLEEAQPTVPRSFNELLAELRALRSTGPGIDYQRSGSVTNNTRATTTLSNWTTNIRGWFFSATAPSREIGSPSSPDAVSEDLLSRARRPVEFCGEERNYKIITGLRNPALLSEERTLVQRELDQAIPTTERKYETEHFTLQWTEKHANTVQNVTEAAVVETADYLEVAHAAFAAKFGLRPFTHSDATKLNVLFYDLGPTIRGNAYPPGGPIELNSRLWTEAPEIRRPTATHELFHKLQYATGFRSQWEPQGTYQWFSEGTASWAEVNICGKVSDALKLSMLFDEPDTGLLQSSYGATPFWIFLETLFDTAPMMEFLNAIRALKDPKTAIEQLLARRTIGGVSLDFKSLYQAFAVACLRGDWQTKTDGSALYPVILGPNDVPLGPPLLIRKETLRASSAFKTFGLVLPLGTDYFSFSIDAGPINNFSLHLQGKVNARYAVHLATTGLAGNIRVSKLQPSGANHLWTIDRMPVGPAAKVEVALSGLSSGAGYEFSVLAD